VSVDLFGTTTPPVPRSGLSRTSDTDTWLTPPALLERLAPFDTDPCASVDQPWRTATVQYTAEDNGLVRPWSGLVWVNPPFADPDPWIRKLARHPAGGIALLHACTETELWHAEVWPRISAAMFLAGRVHFHDAAGRRARGNSGRPVALLAYGPLALARLRAADDLGQLVIPERKDLR
jgi:DNA N-6-adenine-methyltransferase (Dam)